ncbi:hypothetical protein [Rouxiella badensis]|uniref:hypothetical protein n=1 Tax=Rouxiella badensis TaxID=1646377 RepID=UPI0028D0D42C|nr:hypothetical protein [Rouxiella badensis]
MGLLSSLFGPSKNDYKTLLPFQQWIIDYHGVGVFKQSTMGTALLVQAFAMINQMQPELPLYAELLMKHKRQTSKTIIDTILLPELELLSDTDFKACLHEPARNIGAFLLIKIYEKEPERLSGW